MLFPQKDFRNTLIKLLAVGLFVLSSASCGGGGSDVPQSTTPPSTASVFPPFSQVRSDYLDTTEGTAAVPLKVSATLCPYQPSTDWQSWLCVAGQGPPKVYPRSNGFNQTQDPYFSWIIVMNNEFIQDAPYTGPPNQTLGKNEYPFDLKATSSLKLTVTHDARPYYGKIPYMSASYTRGTQGGDLSKRLFGWRESLNKTLELDVDVQRTFDKLSWFRVIIHYRDPKTGQRYFVNKDFVMPDSLATTRFNWNWPYESSFQFPGAIISIPERVPSASLFRGLHHISIPLSGLGVQYFPEFANIEPDILGFEIAIEMAGDNNVTSVEILAVSVKG